MPPKTPATPTPAPANPAPTAPPPVDEEDAEHQAANPAVAHHTHEPHHIHGLGFPEIERFVLSEPRKIAAIEADTTANPPVEAAAARVQYDVQLRHADVDLVTVSRNRATISDERQYPRFRVYPSSATSGLRVDENRSTYNYDTSIHSIDFTFSVLADQEVWLHADYRGYGYFDGYPKKISPLPDDA